MGNFHHLIFIFNYNMKLGYAWIVFLNWAVICNRVQVNFQKRSFAEWKQNIEWHNSSGENCPVWS